MSELQTKENALLKAMKARTADIDAGADLDTVAKLFADVGVKILGGGTAHNFKEEPFVSGVIQRAYVKIQEDDGREKATFVIDIVDSDGETKNVYCNANLFIKLSAAFGDPLPNLGWKRFENETRFGGPDRDAFISKVTDAAKGLELLWVAILFLNKEESRTTGRSYNNFQAALMPREVVQNQPLLDAIEANFKVGADHLRRRDEDGAALPDFLDDDI